MGNYLKSATILYVEDNDAVRLGYAKTLKRYAKELYVAFDGEMGLELFKNYSPDIVITDIKMPKKSGIEMATEIKAMNPEQIILFTTAYSEPEYTLPSFELNIDAYLLKPIDKKKLEFKINALSKRISLEKSLLEERHLFNQILNHQSNVTLVTNFKTIKFASHSFWEMLYAKDWNQFFEMYDSLLSLFVENQNYIHGKSVGEFLKRYYESPDDVRLVSISTAEGPTAFYINLDKVQNISEELFIITLTDVTSLQASRMDALHHAMYDTLTKIYNRHTFETHFERELLRVKRYHRPLCIALFDIDYFKRFNDTFGHLIGDELLVLITQEIGRMVRSTDVFARWGGEEFVLLLSETDTKEAHKALEAIRLKIANTAHPIAGTVTVSIGFTKAGKKDDYKTVFSRCDEALYLAKHNGRNRIEVCL